MKPPLRLVFLAVTAIAGLAAVPIRAADAVLPPAGPRIVLAAEGSWHLRRAEPAAGRHEAPPERMRTVRLVYPALIEPR